MHRVFQQRAHYVRILQRDGVGASITVSRNDTDDGAGHAIDTNRAPDSAIEIAQRAGGETVTDNHDRCWPHDAIGRRKEPPLLGLYSQDGEEVHGCARAGDLRRHVAANRKIIRQVGSHVRHGLLIRAEIHQRAR